MNNNKVYVALIDSGCSFETFEKISINIKNEEIFIEEQENITHLHGDTIANIIKDDFIEFYDIQVFKKNLNTSPKHIFAALNYLLDKNVDVISISLGMSKNYSEIEDICKALIQKGVTIIASYPRSGEQVVYPACYDEVIRVTADGRCENDDISIIEDNLYGVNPHSKIEGISGSSISVAKFTKKYTYYLSKDYTKEQILQRIIDESK